MVTAFEQGWSSLENGDLIRAAEAAQFDLLITTDSNLRYQQNLSLRKIAIVVLRSASWPKIQRKIPEVVAAVSAVKAGGYIEVVV